MNPEDFPAPTTGFVITNFLVVSDQDRSRESYKDPFDGLTLIGARPRDHGGRQMEQLNE
jgi:lactoylglutathione lyase